MTAYSDWIQDFSNRALGLLDRYKQGARENNREVTLLICVGGLLLSAPYERLKKRLDDTGKEIDHSQNERTDWHVGDFDEKMKRSFNDIMTDWNLRSGCWQNGNLGDSDDPKSPDDWKDKQGRGLNDESAWAPLQDLQLGTVINTMRNALAHGQVITYSSGSAQITKLVFLSQMSQKNKPLTAKQRDRLDKQLRKTLPDELVLGRVMKVIRSQMESEKVRYRFIAVPPDEWLSFLKSWVDMLNKFEKNFSYISAA